DRVRRRVYVANADDGALTVIRDLSQLRRLSLPLLLRAGGGGPAPEREPTPSETPTSLVEPSAIDLSLPRRPLEVTTLGVAPGLGEGRSVRAMALDEGRRRLLLASEDELIVLDALSGRTIYTRPLAAPAMALAADEGSGAIYAVLPGRGELCAFGPDGASLGGVDGLGRPTNLVVGLGRIYVADSEGRRVVAIDGESLTIVAERVLPAAPHALALDAEARRLYVGEMGIGTILALDAGTLRPIDQVVLGGLGYPRDLALDGAAGRLYVAHALSPKYGAISAIDVADMSIIGTVWGNEERPLSGADVVAVDGRRGVVLLGQADGVV
ncbi:unnamed protein product, partial [marine sediment metagenome]